MAVVKYSDKYLRGVGTSDLIGQRHEVSARHINALMDKRKAIANDLSRTDDEKAVLYKRLHDEYQRELENNNNRIAVDLTFATDKLNEMRSKARGTMSLSESVSLIAAMRQAGVSGDDLKSAAINDVRIAQALSSAPDAVLAAAKWTRESADAILMRHFPEIAEQEKQIDSDFAALDRLQQNSQEALTELTRRAPDRILKTRVDEKDLFNTALPTPATAADASLQDEERRASEERVRALAEAEQEAE